MLLLDLPNGDRAYRTSNSIFIKFSKRRQVLSTAHLNGGFRGDLSAVFNFNSHIEGEEQYCTSTGTYYDDLKTIAKLLGLSPDETAGISTAVVMKDVAIKTSTYKELAVTAIVTAGISANAGRVGDPSVFYEEKNQVQMIGPGTINIILSINQTLSPGAMARTMVTATEAKTAALQELVAQSKFSRGLATGSGTDETIVISNMDDKGRYKLKFAGKHSKLGELVGITVKEAVKEALFLHTGLGPKAQHNIFSRLNRFGVRKEQVWDTYFLREMGDLKKEEFLSRLASLEKKPDLVTLSCLYAHLMDQLDWELLSAGQVKKEARLLLKTICKRYSVSPALTIAGGTREEVITSMVSDFNTILALINSK